MAGYGWVGPLFWPFAYFDIYDYAIWGSGFGAPFWGYGHDDIYAGMFAPYPTMILLAICRRASRHLAHPMQRPTGCANVR